MSTGDSGFASARIDQHVRSTTRLPDKPRGHAASDTINGREAQPWELAVRERAYAAQRAADAQLVRIPPRSSRE